MPVNLWNTSINKLYLWSTEVTKAYLWSTQVFPPIVSNGLLNNLVSYYKADTSWSFPDAHGSNNGTINGATYTASGKINGAYSFDGIDDYVEFNNNNIATLDNNFSIQLWFNIDNVETTQGFLYKFWLRDIWIRWGNVANNIQFQLYNWTTTPYLNTPVSKNVWNHIVCVREKSLWMKLYLNGILSANNLFTWNANSTPWNDRIWGHWNQTLFIHSLIDEVWFWDVALNSNDVTALYNSWNWLSYNNFTL